VVEEDMRQIAIHTERDQYSPGEQVSGYALVSTSKEFTCNRITLKAQGKEYTHYQAGKVHVSETHKVLSKELTIYEGGVVSLGDTRLDFEFNLPGNIPPTHVGFRGSIQYDIEAVVEISRAIDTKSKTNLIVAIRPPQYIPEPDSGSQPIRRDKEQLLVELPTDIIRPNRDFDVRVCVRERPRVKSVRIEIHRREDIVCRGNKLDSNVLITDKRIPIADSDWDRWIDEAIHFDWGTVTPFVAKLIKTSLVLKVVMEIGLAIDPSIEIPLKVSGEKMKNETDSDSVDLDLGW
jgi:hypothetical protein